MADRSKWLLTASPEILAEKKKKKKTIAWPGVKVPPETCALPGIASEKVAKILKERVQDTDDDLDDAKIPIEVNSGRLSSPLQQRHGRKKGGEQVRARCCCATAGISWAPLRVAPGPCSAPKASCFSQYDEDIYIYICVHPFLFDLESEETPVRSVSSLSLLSSLSRLYSGWGRGRGGRRFVSLLGGCEWETRRTGSGYSRGCGPGAWVIVVESVTCWSGCIRCEPSWSDVVVKLKLLSEIVLFFLGSDYEFSPRSGSLFFYFFIFVVGRFWVRKIFVRWILEFINVDRIDRNYWKSVRYVLRWYMF